MNRLCAALPILLCCAGMGVAQIGESFLVVEVSGRDRSERLEVMSQAEYKALLNEIRNEAKYHARALILAQKDWSADEDNERKTFPRGAISARKAKTVGKPFGTRDAADQALLDLQSRAIENSAREKEREKENAAFLRQVRKMSRRRTRRLPQPARPKDRDLKDQMKEQARKAHHARARDLYEEKLAELMQPREAPQTEVRPEEARPR